MMERHKTFKLRYVGTRFNGARLPLDVISDLPAFRDLLLSYAKDKWRALNSHRKRLPRGFDKSISFDLIGIEEGSAVPRLDWSWSIAQETLLEFADGLENLVDDSFSEVVRLIDGAGHNKFPAALSSEHIRALNRLGSSLLDDEKIEFLGSQGDDGTVVYLDSYRRKALITRVRETYQTRYEGIGQLKGLHLDGRIDVYTFKHGELSLNVDPDRVSQEFDGNTGADVQFSLQIELDNNDKYRSVVEVYDVELIDADISENINRCRTRLQELRALQAGWCDGVGSPLTDAALQLSELFLNKRPYFADAYRLYPTEVGGILIEFEVRRWDFSIEFGPSGTIEMYGVEIDGGGEMEPQEFDSLGDKFLDVFDDRTQG